MLFLSLSARQVDVTQYEWYRFNGKQKRNYTKHHSRLDLMLETGDVFGVKRLGKNFKLVDKTALSNLFTLTPKEIESLLKVTKPYGGKIAGKKVPKGTKAGSKKPSSSPVSRGKDIGGIVITPPKQKSTDKEAAQMLTKLIKMKYPGVSRSKLIDVVDYAGEKRLVVDVTPSIRAYLRKEKKSLAEGFNIWADELEEAIEKAIPNSVAEIEAQKKAGSYIYLLSLVQT